MFHNFPKYISSKSECNTSTGFGLVSLFNGISTTVGYLMPKTSFYKKSSGTI